MPGVVFFIQSVVELLRVLYRSDFYIGRGVLFFYFSGKVLHFTFLRFDF